MGVVECLNITKLLKGGSLYVKENHLPKAREVEPNVTPVCNPRTRVRTGGSWSLRLAWATVWYFVSKTPPVNMISTFLQVVKAQRVSQIGLEFKSNCPANLLRKKARK